MAFQLFLRKLGQKAKGDVLAVLGEVDVILEDLHSAFCQGEVVLAVVFPVAALDDPALVPELSHKLGAGAGRLLKDTPQGRNGDPGVDGD